MAVFNPSVSPGRDDMPSWLKNSSPISEPQLIADKSSGIAVSGAAGALESGATLAENTAKDIIGKDVRNTVEPIREDFSKELELARAAQQNSVVPAAVQGDNGKGLIMQADTNQPAVPDAINAGISKVEALQSALKNGKVNDTYYDLRLKSAVTDLRSKYPGFVDMIDQKVSQITGVNPANAYITNLMQDINQAQSSKKTEYDKSMDLARGAVGDGLLPNAGIQFQKLQSDPNYLSTWQKWYSDESAKLGDIKRKDIYRKASQASREDINEQRTSDWTNEAGASVSSNLSTFVKIPGMDNPKKIIDLIDDMSSHPENYNAEQMKFLGSKILAQKAVIASQLAARAAQTFKDDSGRTYSYNSDVGADKAKQIIESQLSVFDINAKAFNDGNAGLGFYVAHHAQAILDQSKDNLLTDKTVGPWAAKLSNFNELFGNNWTSLVTQSALKNNIDDKLRSYLDDKQLDARLQTSPTTLKQHLEDADRLEKDGRISTAMKSRYIGNLINIVDDIKNKQAPDDAKVNVLKYLFSPDGKDILSHIKTDYTDPNTGKFVPGKYSVFNRFTSDDMVSEVGRLSKAHPEIGQMYKNYLENEAGSQLFYKELQNLNRYTGHDDLHFKYDDGTKRDGIPRIELIDNKGVPVVTRPPIPGTYSTNAPAQDPGYLYRVNQVVNRINEGLSGMGRVERGLGGNANEYLLQFLQRSQVDLGHNWEGLPGKLVDAIAASRAPARRIEDTFKNMQ